MQNNYLITAENVSKWFPIRRGLSDIVLRRPIHYVKAVDNLSFKIRQGEIFVLVGESGCGKTTLGKLLLRAYELDAGKIIFDHIDISTLKGDELKQFRKNAQVIFQDPYASLDPRFTAWDVLNEPLNVHSIGSTKEERKEIVFRAMEDVKLVPPEDFLERFPHMLSGGQRQRLAMARTLVLQPKFIVADEPVSMLDLSIRAEILELMFSLKQRRNITYLYITHDLSTARYVGDTIGIMYLGKIVEMGRAIDVIEKPLHPYTQALLDAVPEPDPSNRSKERHVRITGEIPSPANIPSGCSLHPRCPYAFAPCPTKYPEMKQVSGGRLVSCYLYEPTVSGVRTD
ncbi:MAG: ABC transporter ATP-binding protein [Thaumarchaeota archaeon]|nr:ABC transporter ATP-binding protein [Nitrososphaerota archaeon]